MKKIYVVLTILSCLAGILGFSGGLIVASMEQKVGRQLAYEVQKTCTSEAFPDLSRNSHNYQALLFLSVLKSNDEKLIAEFETALTPSVIQYAAELKLMIETNEKSGGNMFYSETLNKIEKVLDLNAL